jgi:hypothetical protein
LSAHPIARALVVGLAGPWPTAEEAAWLRQWKPAGVILFARNVTGRTQLTRLCAFLHELVPSLEVTADHEGGPISHLAAAVGCPPAPWTLGLVDDPELTRAVHAETARRLATVGVDRVLGPCADVMTNPRNPVIGVRAFGDLEDVVKRHVSAAVGGLQEGGLGSCLKHWPGHGASGTDSHLAAAFSAATHTPAPFEAGIRAGCGAVMVGHLAPEIGALPATLDRDRLETWRRQLGEFSSVPVTLWADDVTMGALRPSMKELGVPAPDHLDAGLVEPGDLPEAWLSALLAAGCDRLLVRGIPWRAFPLGEAEDVLDTALPDVAEETWPEVAAYREALDRACCRLDPGFADPEGDVVWLDFTACDRWDTIVPEQAEARDHFARDLLRRFGRVHRPDGEAPRGLFRPATRLVVTSHRPLEKPWENPEAWHPWLGREGLALVSGHPSLASDFVEALGSSWAVVYCPEMIYR